MYLIKRFQLLILKLVCCLEYPSVRGFRLLHVSGGGGDLSFKAQRRGWRNISKGIQHYYYYFFGIQH